WPLPSTTGTPEMLCARVSASTSRMLVSGPTVIGSRITPDSNRLTLATSAACCSRLRFLWMMPMPPIWAMAIAKRPSVTVSMAAETIGSFNRNSRVRRVPRSTSLGRTVEWAGTSETSSYVSASAWMRSIGVPDMWGSAAFYPFLPADGRGFGPPPVQPLPVFSQRCDPGIAAHGSNAAATQQCRFRQSARSCQFVRFGSLDGVLPQGRHRHRPDTAGHRGDPAGTLRGGLEADIADQAAVIEPVDADIDAHRARLDPFTRHQLGNTHCHHQDVGIAHGLFQHLAGGELVATGDGAAGNQQFQAHRSADMVTDADN